MGKFIFYLLCAGLAATTGFSEGHAYTIIDKQITIQPIVICRDDGTNCVSPDLSQFEAFSDKIWGQAGIDIYFQSTSEHYKSSDLTISYTELTPADPWHDASFFASAQGASSDPSVVNVWFAANLLSPSFGTLLGITNMKYVYNTAFNGMSFYGYEPVSLNDIALNNTAIDNYDYFGVLAHELGHVLGLWHLDEVGWSNFDALFGQTFISTYSPLNLMSYQPYQPTSLGNITPDGYGYSLLTQEQIDIARQSFYVHDLAINPVPEPSTFILLGAGLAGLVAWRRKRS